MKTGSFTSIFLILYSLFRSNPKRCSENMPKICRKTPMPKPDLVKITENQISIWVFCKFREIGSTFSVPFIKLLGRLLIAPWHGFHLFDKEM